MSADGVAFIQHGSWPDIVKVSAQASVLQIFEDPLVPVIKPEVLSAAIELSKNLPEIETLSFDPVYGLGIEDDNGRIVHFGVDGDMSLKVQMYRQLVERLSARNSNRVRIFLMNQDRPFYQSEW